MQWFQNCEFVVSQGAVETNQENYRMLAKKPATLYNE